MTVRYISHVICALQLPKPLDNEDKFLKKREKKTVIRDTRERTEQKSYVNHISLYRLDQINTS